MITKLKEAIRLLKLSWRLLMLDKELLLFPLLSLLVMIAMLSLVAGPIVASQNLQPALDQLIVYASNPDDPAVLAVTFLVYLVSFFIVVFFNAALIACVKIRLSGGDPTVMDGLRSSVQKLPQILLWVLFASTIGFIINQIAQRSEGIAKLLGGFFGFAWAIAIYFAVPVLVSENVSPLGVLKRSAGVIKRKWGQALFAQFGLSIFYVFIMIGSVVSFIIASAIYETMPAISYAIWIVIAMSIIGSIIVFATLDAILKATLYVYATEDKLPPGFTADLFDGAFTNKNPDKI